MKKAIMWCGLFSMVFTATAMAATKEGPNTPGIPRVELRLQNVPNSTTEDSELIQGDEWTFYGVRGDHLKLTVNTRDDFGNGTSGLDPVIVLKDSEGDVVEAADDTFDCDPNAVPVCGYSCPQLDIVLPRTGKYTIVVRDYDSATATDEQCTGGSYLLTVEGPYYATSTLSKAPSVDNGIVGDPPWLQAQLQARKQSRR